MHKAVFTPFCFIFVVATASLMAQTSPTDTAVQEAIRRQADRITLRTRLEQARAAEARHDLPSAATLYDDAYRLVQSIGGVEPEGQQTIAGLTAVRMELAREAQHRGDLRDADLQIQDVLRVNPQNAEAVAFATLNKQMMEQQRGRIPSLAIQEEVPTIRSNKVAAATLVQDGRLLFELGKYDEADAKLKLALKMDPSNQNAVYYSSLVEQAREKEATGRRSLTYDKRMVQVEQAWDDSVKRELLPTPNPMAQTNLIYSSRGRQAIMVKLDRIHLDTVFYDGLPLSEVVRNLSEEAKKRDPDKRGINFLINPNVESVGTPPTAVAGSAGVGIIPLPTQQQLALQQQQQIDPTTGLPIAPAAPASSEQVDVNAVSIRINPALTDVRLADVLDAITTVADHPIKYSIQDYAVVFCLKGPETPQLYMRKFKVDPNTFYQGLQSVSSLDFSTILATTTSGAGGAGGGIGGGIGGGGGLGGGLGSQGGQGGQGGGVMAVPRVSVAGTITGGGGVSGGSASGGGLRFVTATNSMEIVQQAVIQFFRTVGVNLDPTTGKNVFFNDREGTLLVRATSQDLDVIEAAIETLNIAPPEINIKTKFVEVTQNDSRALGFDWYLGNFLMGGGNVVASGGTQPSLNGANPPSTIFPGTPSTANSTATTINPATTDQVLTSGLRNSAPSLATFTGILTDPQFRVVIHALEQRDGADVLNEGQVTTLSGRQAQIQVVDLRYIVTGTSIGTTAGAGAAGGTAGVGTTVNAPIAQNIVPIPTPIPLGPTLDVVPYVSADGYTIQMTIIPTVVEFVQYDDPGPFGIVAQVSSGVGSSVPLTAVLPLPHFRIRQVTTSAIVWDGQTVVLGGLISDNIARVKDKVPVLGDIPLVGRLFRSESNSTQKKNLVIFVTPTIIDPAGNRLHSDDDLPFAQNSIPPQKPVENP